MIRNKTITCEYVSNGHPDKLADRISDSILSAYFDRDKNVRAGIEVMVKDNIVVLGGEIKSNADYVNVEKIVRNVFSDINYPKSHNLSADNIKVINLIGKQSQEISQGVDKNNGVIGAGDQGFVVGYASNESQSFLPLGVYLAKKICKIVSGLEQIGPDLKTQVTVHYDNNGKATVTDILVSAMHTCSLEEARNKIKSVLDFYVGDVYGKYNCYINPCGEWKIGGPVSDCGITGRKIVVDQFGGYCNVGGGNLHGKDMSKVDRSGAYMARYIAKNIVASGLASSAKIDLSFIISSPYPSDINIELEDSKINKEELKEWLLSNVDMSVNGIIERFGNVNNFVLTSIFGDYGNDVFPWEKTDLADSIRRKFFKK